MRRTLIALLSLSLLLGLGPSAVAASVPPRAACAAPRCIDVAVPYPSSLKVPEDHVRIVLPAGYARLGPGYPVLYLLHGAGDTYRTWVENTDLLDFTKHFKLIVVMPDGGRNSNAGWYSDWKDGSRDWESFHIHVLIPWVDSHYNTLGDGHRAVAGLSMGGFGAMSYAARHPGLFSAAASFSGAVDTQYGAPVSGVAFAQLHDRFGTPDDRVWGDQVQNAKTWTAHNPTAHAADLQCTPLWISTGDGAPGGPAGDDPSNPGGYFIEHFIWQMNQSFVRALDDAGVQHHDDFYGGGYHGWPYWQMALHWALPQMMKAIVRRSPPCPLLDRRQRSPGTRRR
jgi:diacylglycerol O-acyltransferase/trehalose O-mycolyltransferase